MDAMVSRISLQEKAWKRGVGTHVALSPDPAEVRQVGGSTSREESSCGTGCPRTGEGGSVMGLCRGAHMMKIFTRLSRLQAQERPEPQRYEAGEGWGSYANIPRRRRCQVPGCSEKEISIVRSGARIHRELGFWT